MYLDYIFDKINKTTTYEKNILKYVYIKNIT